MVLPLWEKLIDLLLDMEGQRHYIVTTESVRV